MRRPCFASTVISSVLAILVWSKGSAVVDMAAGVPNRLCTARTGSTNSRHPLVTRRREYLGSSLRTARRAREQRQSADAVDLSCRRLSGCGKEENGADRPAACVPLPPRRRRCLLVSLAMQRE